MIASLTGTIAEKMSGITIIDVGGVGYGVLMADDSMLSTGVTTKVYIYEHIRENTHDLYGFTSLDIKQLFEQLLEVNGIGPKMALAVLGIGNAQAVRQAIASGDVKFIQQANGVGKRVAERMVVELKDKVGLAGVELSATGLLQSDMLLKQDEAVEALVTLGYSAQDAVQSLATIPKDLSTEERVRQALKR